MVTFANTASKEAKFRVSVSGYGPLLNQTLKGHTWCIQAGGISGFSCCWNTITVGRSLSMIISIAQLAFVCWRACSSHSFQVIIMIPSEIRHPRALRLPITVGCMEDLPIWISTYHVPSLNAFYTGLSWVPPQWWCNYCSQLWTRQYSSPGRIQDNDHHRRCPSRVGHAFEEMLPTRLLPLYASTTIFYILSYLSCQALCSYFMPKLRPIWIELHGVLRLNIRSLEPRLEPSKRGQQKVEPS